MKKLALAAASLGLAITATPAFADNAVVRTTVVKTAGLDLSSPEGQKILDRRVEAAARSVCDIELVSTGSRIKSVDGRRCYRKAISGAKRQVAAVVADHQLGG